MSPDGAPLTPTPATTASPTRTGWPPGRMTKLGSAIRPGEVLAASWSPAVGLWNPTAAAALPRATSTVAPVVPSARCRRMSTPSRSTTATVTAKPRLAQSCCAAVASCWAAANDSTWLVTTTGGVDDGGALVDDEELGVVAGRAADPVPASTAMPSPAPSTPTTPKSVQVRFTGVLLGSVLQGTTTPGARRIPFRARPAPGTRSVTPFSARFVFSARSSVRFATARAENHAGADPPHHRWHATDHGAVGPWLRSAPRRG